MDSCRMEKYCLAQYLKTCHHGAENAVTSKLLEALYRVSGKQLRDMVNTLRREGVPIASDQNGYYYAKTKAELRSTIKHMRCRISGICAAISGLRLALADFEATQMHLTFQRGDGN